MIQAVPVRNPGDILTTSHDSIDAIDGPEATHELERRGRASRKRTAVRQKNEKIPQNLH